MERVSVYRPQQVIGNSGYSSMPVTIVAPHGADDTNTATVAEAIIKKLGCGGVINRGWERADKYDYSEDKADCNRISHCLEDVVKDEFLDPFVGMINNWHNRSTNGLSYVFQIHGVGNWVRSGQPKLDAIIGFGDGDKPSFTCERWMVDEICFCLEAAGMESYVASSGSLFAGRSKDNLNQLFRRKQFRDQDVMSMQIEIVKELRKDIQVAQITGEVIAKAIATLVSHCDLQPHRNYATKVL